MARLFCAAAALLAFLTSGGSASGQTSGSSSSPRSTRASPSSTQSQTLQVELTNTIRAKKAKVGDVVKARTVTALILAGQTVVPEGSKLIGHVVRVDSPTSGTQGTALAIAFDEFLLKNKRTLRADFSVRAGALPQLTVRQATPQEGDEAVAPTVSPGPVAPRATHTSRLGGGSTYKNQASQPGPPPQRQINEKGSEDNRGDLRAVRGGTLVGMPGVTLRIDGPAGAATFESSNRKLELKSGLQLMLRVDPRTDTLQQK